MTDFGICDVGVSIVAKPITNHATEVFMGYTIHRFTAGAVSISIDAETAQQWINKLSTITTKEK